MFWAVANDEEKKIMSATENQRVRIIHRYLGFYLVGIMAVYAISGIVLIFRKGDTFKVTKTITTTLEPNLSPTAIGEKIKLKGLRFTSQQGDIAYFEQGNYNVATGEVAYQKKQLPYVLERMTKLHKATTKSPAYWLNILFGVSLLFFVVSSFWMFLPQTTIFKKGLMFSLAGLLMALLLVFL